MEKEVDFLVKDDLIGHQKVILIDAEGTVPSAKIITRLLANNQYGLLVFHGNMAKPGNFELIPERHLQRIRIFSWHPFSFIERYKAHDFAYEAIDQVYDSLCFSDQIPIKPAIQLFNDQRVVSAFKKEILVKLQRYFEICLAAEQLGLCVDEVVLFPSEQWLEIDKVVDGDRILHRNNFKIESNGVIKRANRLVAKIRLLSILLGVPFWMMKNIRRLTRIPKPKRFDLGVRLYRNGWQLNGNGSYEADWMLNGHAANHSNTVFICESDLIPRTHQSIISRGYHKIMLPAKNNYRQASIGFLKHELFGNALSYVISVIKNLNKISVLVYDLVLQVPFEYLKWKQFSERCQLKIYISYNDTSPSHIFRNIVLKQNGCQPLFVDHSNSRIFIYDNRGAFEGLEATRGFMYYSKELYWGKSHLEIANKQRSVSENFGILGPIWNLKRSNHSDLETTIEKKWGKSRTGLVIAAFNTSLNPQAINTEVTHCLFLEALLGLLLNPDYPGLKIMMKTKQKDYIEQMGKEGTDISAVFANLKQHPNFLLLQEDYSNGTIMAHADIGISMAFASSSIEAVLSGNKAFYYDAGNCYQYSLFEQFPSFVAHRESELTACLEFWNGLTESGLKEYQRQYIEKEFCDLHQSLDAFSKEVMINSMES